MSYALIPVKSMPNVRTLWKRASEVGIRLTQFEETYGALGTVGFDFAEVFDIL